MGGHFTDPYEQKTQQSPVFGRSNAWQPTHSWKYRQASVGMRSIVTRPQCGQVNAESSIGDACMLGRLTLSLS